MSRSQVADVKLRLHEAITGISPVGRLPDSSNQPRVNMYLPEIKTDLLLTWRR
jgi:hypothetical protein